MCPDRGTLCPIRETGDYLHKPVREDRRSTKTAGAAFPPRPWAFRRRPDPAAGTRRGPLSQGFRWMETSAGAGPLQGRDKCDGGKRPADWGGRAIRHQGAKCPGKSPLSLVCFGEQGKGDGKSRSCPGIRCECDLSVKFIDDALGHGQAEPRPSFV